MKNKRWVLHVLASLAGICVYTAYRLGVHWSVFLWGTAIAMVMVIVINHIFRLDPRKPAREAYAEYLERQQEKKKAKQETKT